MDKHKDDEADGVDNGQPKRDEDANRLEIWLVKLAEKQICALEGLKEAVDCLLDALLQGEGQEEDNLEKVDALF